MLKDEGRAFAAARIRLSMRHLTPAEASIASGIAEGSTLEQLARKHAVTIDTVRVQSKAVFAKTGTHRQAQVVALLSGLAKIPVA